MNVVGLGWHPDRLILWRDGETQTLAESIPADQRYSLELDSRISGEVFVARLNAALARLEGDQLGDLPHPPCPDGRWKLHQAAGIHTVLDGHRLHVLQPEGWTTRTLQPEMKTRDIDFTPEGVLWCVGSVPSRRLGRSETEASVRVQPTQDAAWQARSPRLGPIAAMRAVSGGGLTELRTIDASGSPVVATSLCEWFIEDESSFLFVFGRRGDQVTRLRNDLVRRIDRPAPGLARAWTVHGSVWTLSNNGMERRSLLTPLREAIDLGPRHLTVRGVDAEGSEVVVAIEVAHEGRTSEADDGESTAICVSTDEGRHFTVVRRDRFADGPEWASVALIRTRSNL